MIRLKKFIKSPFKHLNVGKDKTFKFFEDHNIKLSQSVANGEPFTALVAPTESAFQGIKTALGNEASTLAQKESKTKSLDFIIEEFKTIVTLREPNILVKYPKKSAIYEEFFPHGKSEYTNANKANIEKLMAQLISAIDKHKTDLGQPLLDEFTALQTAYVNARKEQLNKKEDTEAKSLEWDKSLEIMQKQAFKNLLTLSIQYMDMPEKIKLFFDESIVRPRHYNDEGEEIEPYTLTVGAGKSVAANISFSVDDSLFIEVTGETSLFYYGALSADAPCPATAIEILAGDSAEVTALSLGAPANKYLIFTNKDTTQEGEVEITLLA